MARIDLGTRPDGSRDRQTRSFATRDEAEVWCCELDRFANAKLKEGLAPSTVNRPRVGRFTCQCPRRVPRSLRSRAERRHIPPRQLPPPAIAPLRERVLARVDRRGGDVVAAAHMAWAPPMTAAFSPPCVGSRCWRPCLGASRPRSAALQLLLTAGGVASGCEPYRSRPPATGPAQGVDAGRRGGRLQVTGAVLAECSRPWDPTRRPSSAGSCASQPVLDSADLASIATRSACRRMVL